MEYSLTALGETQQEPIRMLTEARTNGEALVDFQESWENA